MAIIGTSTQPGFYEEKAAKAGQLIQMLLAQQSQRQARQDAQEKEQLNFFFQAVEKDPSIANAMGPDLVKRYGEKYPVLPAIVQSMQQKQKILGDMDSATQAFTDKLGSMQSDYKQMQEHASTLPDTLPFNVHVPTIQGSASTGSGIPWLDRQSMDANASMANSPIVNPPLTLQMPNPEKARVQATLSQMNPGMFPTSAAMALPANQQILLRMNPAVAHLLPKEMPSLQDIPEAQRPLVMGQMGLVSPEIVSAAKMQLGITPKPADIQKQGAAMGLKQYENDALDTRQSGQQDWADQHQQQQLENQKTIEQIKDTHSKQRIAQNLGGLGALEDRKISGQKEILGIKQGVDGAIPWKALTDSSSAEMKDWQAAYSRLLQRQKQDKVEGADAVKQQQGFLQANPRPVRVPEPVARIITMNINRKIKADPTQAEVAPLAAMNMKKMYTDFVRQGASPEEATSILLRRPGYQDTANKYKIPIPSAPAPAPAAPSPADQGLPEDDGT